MFFLSLLYNIAKYCASIAILLCTSKWQVSKFAIITIKFVQKYTVLNYLIKNIYIIKLFKIKNNSYKFIKVGTIRL